MTTAALCLVCAGASLLYLFVWQIPWFLKLGQPRAGQANRAIDVCAAILLVVVARKLGWPNMVVVCTCVAVAAWHLLWDFTPALQKPRFQAALSLVLITGGALLWIAR